MAIAVGWLDVIDVAAEEGWLAVGFLASLHIFVNIGILFGNSDSQCHWECFWACTFLFVALLSCFLWPHIFANYFCAHSEPVFQRPPETHWWRGLGLEHLKAIFSIRPWSLRHNKSRENKIVVDLQTVDKADLQLSVTVVHLRTQQWYICLSKSCVFFLCCSPEQQERVDSLGPSCVSMKSDRSMGQPPEPKDGRSSGEER